MPPTDLHRLFLRHPDGETPVLVGEGALATALPELSSWLAGRTAFLVSTPRVLDLHGHRLEPLRAAAARWAATFSGSIRSYCTPAWA